MRPLATNPPIEIVAGENMVVGGAMDGSPGIPDDIASEAALRQMIGDGCFACEREESFECALYWNAIEEMTTDVSRENWRRYKLPAESAWAEARQFLARTTERARVRVRFSMVIVRYRRVP